MRYREIGCTRVWFREADGCFDFHPDDFVPLTRAWRNGDTFYEGRDVYGDTLVVKLALVVTVMRNTPENIAISLQDRENDRLLRGDE